MAEKLVQLDFLAEQKFAYATNEMQEFKDEARRSIRGLFARYNDLYAALAMQQKLIDKLMFREVVKEDVESPSKISHALLVSTTG
jgi:hypothetical protein